MNGREYVEAVMKEAERAKAFSVDELSCFRNVADWYQRYCQSIFANYQYFEIETGKVFGDNMESLIIKSFPSLTKWEGDTSFDAITTDGKKIEIKSLRAEKKEDDGEFKPLLERIVSIKSNSLSGFSTSSFQQTKPGCCDWFIYHVLYGDGDRLFLIPSSMVSKHPGKNNKEDGKFLLSKQHRDHPDEGQVNLGEVKKYGSYFEISDYDHNKIYDLKKCQNEVVARMNSIGWKLPKIGMKRK